MDPRRWPTFVQNLRRGQHDIATDTPSRYRLRVASDDVLALISGLDRLLERGELTPDAWR